MSLQQIKSFSAEAKTNSELGAKLKECQKIKEMLVLGKEYGFNMDEVELYPPNEPQFTEDQLSEKLVKALLRV
ncbi:putative ribosomally synthesized peptide with nif11-like leader [Alteromonadaceae bacterium 2753L.S.0a.02]|nr:putative ribosomally synthesized peptide with nif11-like leader [Alteromonadaceae bacterium 2753L.S.0a.02]